MASLRSLCSIRNHQDHLTKCQGISTSVSMITSPESKNRPELKNTPQMDLVKEVIIQQTINLCLREKEPTRKISSKKTMRKNTQKKQSNHGYFGDAKRTKRTFVVNHAIPEVVQSCGRSFATAELRAFRIPTTVKLVENHLII